jgi:hypothetical protein
MPSEGIGVDTYYDFENDNINFTLYPKYEYLLGTPTSDPKVGNMVTVDDAKEPVYEITGIDGTMIKMSDGNSEFTLNTETNEITQSGVVKINKNKATELKKNGFTVKGFFKSLIDKKGGKRKTKRYKNKSGKGKRLRGHTRRNVK